MRKLFLIAGLTFTFSASFGQKIEDVKKEVSAGKYAEAKTKLDLFFADSKNASNAEAQFYKAVIYNNLAKQKPDSATSAAALEAIKTYLKMEESKPAGQQALLLTLENHKTVVDIYQNYFAQGIENFKKNSYTTAFHNFEKALDAFEILSKKSLTNAKFDTTAMLYAGYSAQNAQMPEQAIKYYDKIINLNVSDTNSVGIYRYMINANLEKKDTATARKYLAISEQRYPMYKDVWLDYKTLFLSSDKTKRFDEYEALVKANPGNDGLAMNYAIELYNYLRSNEAAENDLAMRQKAEAALKNVLTNDPNSTMGNLLISQFYWSELYPIQNQMDAVKGKTAKDLAARKELTTKLNAVFDKVFPYLTKSYDLYSQQTTLKPQDKANYKIVLGQLAAYHQQKNQTAKAAEYQQKLKSIQ